MPEHTDQGPQVSVLVQDGISCLLLYVDQARPSCLSLLAHSRGTWIADVHYRVWLYLGLGDSNSEPH